MDTEAFVAAWEDAVARRDAVAVSALLAEDVTFRSPALHRPTLGREAAGIVLGHVIEVFGDFAYVGAWHSDDGVVLRFATSVERDGRVLEVDGVDVFRLDAEGRAVELSVMVRPLSALQALSAAMLERLARTGGD